MSNIDQIIDRFSKMPYHKEGNKPYGAPVVYLSEIDYLIDNLREQKNEIKDTKLSEILTCDLVNELAKRGGVEELPYIPHGVEYLIEIYDGDKFTKSDTGPARVLVVID